VHGNDSGAWKWCMEMTVVHGNGSGA